MFFIVAVGFCLAATYGGWLRTLDFAFYDALLRTYQLPLQEEVVIVGVDEQSLSTYGSWPWPRDEQAELLDAVNAHSPKAVFLDFVYGGTSTATADMALAEAAGAVDVLALPMMVDALAAGRQLIEVLPYPELLDAADVLGHVHIELDADASARGTYLYQGVGEAHWPHVVLGLAARLYPAQVQLQPCGGEYEFSLQSHRCDFVYTPFSGPPGTHAEVSASALFEDRVPKRFLQDKIVFVGITTTGAPDAITSPASAESRPMSGVEFNANLFSALLQDRTISDVGIGLRMAFALLCIVLPVLLLPRLKAKTMLATTAGFAVLPISITAVAFFVLNVHLPLAAAAITIFLSYPYWSWRRNEIAWQFVNTEFERLAVEKPRWAIATDIRARPDDLGRIESMFGATAHWQAEPVVQQSSTQIAVEGADGRWLVMSRETPFTAQETALGQRLLTTQTGATADDLGLPGEMLAAEIRKLQNAATEVRLGREVGLRGLEEMPNGVAVLSALNRVLFLNHACAELLGLPPDRQEFEFSDLTRGLVPPLGANWQELSRRVIVEQRQISFEAPTENGRTVVVEGATLATTGEVTETWVLTITDVSDIRAAERDREEALAFLSHDLRSPMLSVLALLRGSHKPNLLEDIERYTQKALSVSEQFVQLSRVQAREQFEVYDIDLDMVLDNAVNQVFALARDKRCTLQVEIPSLLEGGAWIIGNGELLERALVNLLTNAIKYSHTGGHIGISLETDVGEQSVGTYSVLIADDGIGIPVDEVERVFDPYFRSNHPELAAQKGAGLGLRFVKTVVERHGGTVTVDSTLGEGSRFIVTLPRSEIEAND